jgi:hypothetical protein
MRHSVKLKENEAEARERLRAFWAGSSLGRPGIYIVVDRPGYVGQQWPGPLLASRQADESPEWQAYRAAQLRGRQFMAEAFPYVFPVQGSMLTLLADLAGMGHRFEGDNAWIEPMRDALDHPVPAFDPAHPVIALFDRQIEAMAASLGDDGIVGPPPLLDGLTTLSELISQEELCVALSERPDDVRRWAAGLDVLGRAAYEHFHRKLAALGYCDTAAWIEILAEGTMEAVQCDFAVMLSPTMFEDIVVPLLTRSTEFFDYSLYHLDGTCQMRFLDALAKIPGLNGIQWNPEPRESSVRKWLPALKEIRRRGLVLQIGCEVEEAVALTRELGPDGFFISVRGIKTAEEGQRVIERIEKAAK